MRRLPVVTNSELKTFNRCRREHYFAYELGYRSLADAEALRFGTLFHVGLQAWWLTPSTDDRLAAAIDAIGPHAQDEYDLVRAGVLLQGYDARWANENLEVLAVEAEFRAPLLNPATGAPSRTFELGGKLDAIVRQRDTGHSYIVEHKTSSEDLSPGSQYWQRLTLDSQVSIYYAGARSLGHDPHGCLYDVISKPRHAPKRATPEELRKYTRDGRLYANQRATDETADEFRLRLLEEICDKPDQYYQRSIVVRLEEDERDAAYDAWQTSRAIREAQLSGRWPRNSDACMRYGRVCSYFGVCTRTASLEDPSRYVRVDNVHQELSIDAA